MDGTLHPKPLLPHHAAGRVARISPMNFIVAPSVDQGMLFAEKFGITPITIVGGEPIEVWSQEDVGYVLERKFCLESDIEHLKSMGIKIKYIKYKNHIIL